jgi:integrase
MEPPRVVQSGTGEGASDTSSGSRAPKLLDRVRHVIRAKHYSRRTESAYVDWIRRYILFHKKRHPSEMGASEITSFLTWLASDRHVSASTQNQALSAVLFLYRDVLHVKIGTIEHVPRARMPVRVPVVLSHDEVGRIMKQLDGSQWLIVALLYGAGLRLQECLELRIKDIDLERRQIVIRRGKGQKDRPTVLPASVIALPRSTGIVRSCRGGSASWREEGSSRNSVDRSQRTPDPTWVPPVSEWCGHELLSSSCFSRSELGMGWSAH